MAAYAALLRGINSGMNPSQKMENLRTIFEDLGFKNVKSVLASGNILFETRAESRTALERKIEKALLKGTGVESATIIRTKEEVQKLIDRKPFKDVKITKKKRPHATFLKQMKKPRLSSVKKGKGYEILGVYAGVICYVIDLTGTRTPDVMKDLEKEFGKNVTTRSWNTVEKIAKLLI